MRVISMTLGTTLHFCSFIEQTVPTGVIEKMEIHLKSTTIQESQYQSPMSKVTAEHQTNNTDDSNKAAAKYMKTAKTFATVDRAETMKRAEIAVCCSSDVQDHVQVAKAA